MYAVIRRYQILSKGIAFEPYDTTDETCPSRGHIIMDDLVHVPLKSYLCVTLCQRVGQIFFQPPTQLVILMRKYNKASGKIT